MKKITRFLTLIALVFISTYAMAQTCNYVEAGITNGTDQDGAATPIDMSCVPAGNQIDNVVVNDFTSHYNSPTGTTTWCPSWYYWDIVVNGNVEAASVCGTDMEAFDYSAFAPINSIEFVISDADGFNDTVYMDIDATITYSPSLGTPPVISCPADIVVDSAPGVCGAVVNFADATAIDAEDGVVATSQTGGPVSGSVFPTGTTTVTFEATDTDGNTVSCDFTVTVNDVEAPMAMCQDMTVELDATGTYVLNAADVAAASTDNCGVTDYYFGGYSPETLSGPFNSDNGFDGNMFDVSAASDVIINSFDVNLDTGTYDVEVYYKTGTWVGSDTTAGDWTLLDTAAGVVSAGTDNPTSLGLSLGLSVMAGDTVAFYVVSTSGGWNYTNGTTVGNVWFSDANLTVYEGAGKQYPWGSTFSPRNFNGNIHYDYVAPGSGPTLTLDCSNVGTNAVSVTIADAAGNTTSCSSTVTVEDNQAPVVICKGSGGAATIEEMFEAASVPADWSTEVVSGGWDWTFGSNHMPGTDDFATNAAVFDDDAEGGSGVENIARLYSPMADISSAAAANLSFDYALGDFAGSGILIVEVWDGSAWTEVFTADNADIPPTNSGVMDMLPYANGAFQVRFTYDDEDAGWNWGAGVDNFVLSYDLPPTPPLEVVLDADGTANVDLNDLLYSVEDNCDVSVTLGGNIPSACEQSNPSNGFENGYFTDPGHGFIVANDITLDPGMDFTLDHIQANLFHDVGSTISSVDITYYEDAGGQPGAEIGYDFGVAPVAQTVVGNNFGFDVSTVDFDVTPFALTGQAGASTTYWVSMIVSNSVGGTTAWELTTASTNGYESLSSDGTAWNGGSGDGVYVFSGSCTGGVATSLDVDCTMLGENMVDVIVTDAGGNEASCTATVMVVDNTAPVLECGPEPTLHDTGMASIEPGLTIDTNGSDVIVTSVLTVTEDQTIEDLNVPVNISHTWIGDIYMTLTSPAGTTVVLHNMSGGSAQDIVMTYDDEGTPAAEALSAFDGESTMGDWTLYIEDTWPGLDGGMLNSWGLEWEYSYPNPETDMIVELGADGTVTITPEDITYVMDEACGFDVVLLDVTDFDCSNIGTPTLVTLFANDTSGNFASCQVEVYVEDRMAPTLTCTAEHGLAFDPVTGFAEMPDFVDWGDIAATDNCTLEGDIVYTQDPAPGTMLTPTTESTPHVVTATATDEYGNVATCTFDVYVRNIGVAEDTALAAGISLYPNPAVTEVTLSNTSQIAVHTAEIYDVNGKLVRSFNLTSDVSKLDVSDLSSGIFMVKVIGDEASTVEQLVKK